MRSFENRSDTVVVDEPFFGPYLAGTGLEHPVAKVVIDEQGSDWQAVAARLAAPLEHGATVQFQKQMAHHQLPTFGREWMRAVRHAFLIRDQREILASYVKKREEVTLADLGLAQQVELYDWVVRETGQAPYVVEACALLSDPRAELTRLCAALGLAFDEAMLAWPAGRRDSDGIWASWWYDKLMRSTGFFEWKPKAIELDADLEALAHDAAPYYERLLAAAQR